MVGKDYTRYNYKVFQQCSISNLTYMIVHHITRWLVFTGQQNVPSHVPRQM